ncbi:hypothetical protein HK105_207580 [Polyrhizophydium stewartii]|uniref:L domain-like protein n=1 Tax=Polyrhizophydium stewartii TaxID=2732419 RepID=A0ABR4N057_9FUNG
MAPVDREAAQAAPSPPRSARRTRRTPAPPEPQRPNKKQQKAPAKRPRPVPAPATTTSRPAPSSTAPAPVSSAPAATQTANASGDPTAAADCAVLATASGRQWGKNCCLFGGVSCSAGRVTELNLHAQNLTGPIPPAIGSLSALVAVHLESNEFTGPIPSSLGSLESLETLWLFDNRLSGSIPLSFTGFKRLQSLRISNNALAGTIPAGMGKIPTLFSFILPLNELGTLPCLAVLTKSIDNLDSHFDGNANITGSLPDFAPTLDCSGAGTRSCLPKSSNPAFCGLQYCDPSVNADKAPAAAELPFPTAASEPDAMALSRGAAGSPQSSSSSSIFTQPLVIGAGVGALLVIGAIGMFIKNRLQQKTEEKALYNPNDPDGSRSLSLRRSMSRASKHSLSR